MTKICIECQLETNKPQRGMCVKCYSKWYYKNNREKIIEKSKKWIGNNKEKHRSYVNKTKAKYRNNQSVDDKRNEWLSRQENMSEQEKQNRRDRSKRYYYENKEKLNKRNKEYRENNKEKIKAEKEVMYAVRIGKIPHISTQLCYLCKRQAQHYHHWSYEPEHRLNVIPLCKSCHGKVHANIVSLIIPAVST